VLADIIRASPAVWLRTGAHLGEPIPLPELVVRLTTRRLAGSRDRLHVIAD
jgi:hypothetical protein